MTVQSEQSEPKWGAPEEPPRKPRMRRGWLIALGVGIALFCLVSGACMLSCGLLFKKGKVEGAKQMTAVLQSAAVRDPRAAEYEKELARLNMLIDNNDVELMAIGAISSRLQSAQKDGQIDPVELEQIMLVVKRINRNHGELGEDNPSRSKPQIP
ncbi:MAG: hypothetical protein IPJ88_08690 [Myxococcales bacterium]|nr:MAG: hypothetical protein IPJ88_08690 [Myxococcales bacterium]